MNNETTENGTPIPSLWLAFTPLIALVGMLSYSICAFGTDALSGASQLTLMVAGAIAATIGMGVYRLKWKSIERVVIECISEVMPSILLLILIGALSGAWMVSGIVPGFIYYGMKIIHPEFFLATACIICTVVSMMTGSSWTTIATIGLALVGIGTAQGFHPGIVGGAIISGAYFGDKMSPLSDTTILASSVTGTPLFTHIRYMTATTIPAMSITLVIFVILGLNYDVSATEHMDLISRELSSKFNITPWVFLVPVLTVALIALKTPSMIALFLSAAMGAAFALLVQPEVLQEISADNNALKGVIKAIYGKCSLSFPDRIMVELTESNGMAGMLDTIWLIICAMVFGGIMRVCRMLDAITLLFMRCIRGRTSLVAATALSGSFFNMVLADQYLAIILTGGMYMPIYRRKGYETRLLSRTTEDSVTVVSPLIPWSTCGMTQATILNVPTVSYLPYCFFNLLCPIFTIIVAMTGFGIGRAAEKQPGTDI